MASVGVNTLLSLCDISVQQHKVFNVVLSGLNRIRLKRSKRIRIWLGHMDMLWSVARLKVKHGAATSFKTYVAVGLVYTVQGSM